MTKDQELHVAIVGAGPAGLFAAQKLASSGYGVALFNRDIKPGGLVEYGIFLEKHKIKNGFRNQFRQILDDERVEYYGNVSVGKAGKFNLENLFQWGFQAVLVSCGAQGTKLINLPGENLKGVYHAKDLVYHYNQLPPYSSKPFPIGKKVAIIGAGNVMTDIAHYLICYCDVEEILVVIRRGPGEVKFDQKEVLPIIAHLDMDDFSAEMDRVTPAMLAIGQDPEAAQHRVTVTLEKACPKEHSGRIIFRFLHSPVEILSDAEGKVRGIKTEHNTLEKVDEQVLARGSGETEEFMLDNVIFAIGDEISDDLNLPLQGGRVFSSPKPKFPVEGISFEVGDPQTGQPVPGLFIAGWSRNPSTGLAGIARRDGVFAASAIEQYLQSLEKFSALNCDVLEERLKELGLCFVGNENLKLLEEDEKRQAEKTGQEEFKYPTNDEMLEAMMLQTCR